MMKIPGPGRLHYRTLPSDVLGWLGDGHDTNLEWNYSKFRELCLRREPQPLDDIANGFERFDAKRMTDFEWSARLVGVVDVLANTENCAMLRVSTSAQLSGLRLQTQILTRVS
jgi:hypothetical protein